MLKKGLLFCLGVFYVFYSLAQSKDLVVKENYNGHTFVDFAASIENTYKYKFFYPNNLLDSVYIFQSESDTTLSGILKNTFRTSGINYYIDQSNTVFITNNYDIVVSLPIYFYEVNADDVKKSTASSFLYERKVTKKKQLSSTVVFGDVTQKKNSNKAVLRGRLTDDATGEPIIGAVVWSLTASRGTATDFNGNYMLELPKGKHKIEFRSVGKETISQDVVLYANGQLDFSMNDAVMQLADVRVVAEKFKNVEGLQMGLEKVNVKTIKQLPTSMGEVDVLKVALMLPGVQTVGEGASGFNVRGGATDQNLILLDQSPLFNSSHLFGFFSVFNPDIINDFILYKSAIPSQYGGRISSVFDVSSKSGNKKRWHINAGVSPVTGRIMAEGPVIKDKLSVLIAARTTYSDWILSKINHPTFKNSEASFYDINAKVKYEMNEKNFFNLSYYTSNDNFKLNSDTTYDYSNMNGSLQWKYIHNNKFYVNSYYVFSNYKYDVSSDENINQAFKHFYNINYNEIKTDFHYSPGARHKLNLGIGGIYYYLEPGTRVPITDSSKIKKEEIQHERAIEANVHLEDEMKITERFAVQAGIRLSMFFVMGARDVYNYYNDVTKSQVSISDTTTYGSGDLVKTYTGPEWRLSSRYKFDENTSLKFSYNRLYQYIHMMTNTMSVSPTDIWKLSDYHIKPQMADVFTLGIYRDVFNHVLETSVELYYKNLSNQLEFKGGADINLNPIIESEIIEGKGKAYGVELLIKKKHGYLNGWFAYTYSRSLMQVNGEFTDEKINNGEWYPSNFDKPHDLTLVLNNKFTRRLSVSSTVTYSTGKPTTRPVAKYEINGVEILHYSERNEYRIPDYFRWDLSLNIEGNLKKKKFAHSYWTFSVYNLTGRSNVYSEYFKLDENDNYTGYRLSIFARPIFTIAYNVKI